MTKLCPICHEPSHLTGCGAAAIEDLAEARDQLRTANGRAEEAESDFGGRLRAAIGVARTCQEAHAVTLTKLATARALALEEAARAIDDAGYIDVQSNGEDNAECPGGNVVRRLALLPPDLVAVPRKTLEQVRRALDEWHGSNHRMALAALKLVMG